MIPFVLFSIVVNSEALAVPKTAVAPPPAVVPVPAAGLVIALTTGVEDGSMFASAFRHARVAKQSGLLPEITVIVYGRAILVVDPAVKAADDARKELVAAREAGVRIVVCANSLEKYGIDPAVVAPYGEVVPSAIEEIAALVARGHEVMNY